MAYRRNFFVAGRVPAVATIQPLLVGPATLGRPGQRRHQAQGHHVRPAGQGENHATQR